MWLDNDNVLIHDYILFHWHVQNVTIPCCSQEFIFHSFLLRTFSCHSSPPAILPSSLTSSCHLFLGLLLNFVVPKFIYNALFGNGAEFKCVE